MNQNNNFPRNVGVLNASRPETCVECLRDESELRGGFIRLQICGHEIHLWCWAEKVLNNIEEMKCPYCGTNNARIEIHSGAYLLKTAMGPAIMMNLQHNLEKERLKIFRYYSQRLARNRDDIRVIILGLARELNLWDFDFNGVKFRHQAFKLKRRDGTYLADETEDLRPIDGGITFRGEISDSEDEGFEYLD